jgi:Domain of unknown function (DUF4407)
MSKIKEFFWFCAGTNRSLLKRCPTEASKFTGIGAAVFFTGVLAALSGGYAMHTVFDNYYLTIAFALLWGAIIFNLDRFIVSTMRKRKEWYKEWVMASPRVLLAVVLAIVISKPLELRIFSNEIDRKLVTLEEGIYQREISDVEQRYLTQLSTIQNQITALKGEIENKASRRDKLKRIAQEEADGTGGSMKRDAGPIYQIKKKDAEQAQLELEQTELSNHNLIAAKQSEWDQLFNEKRSEIQALKRNPWDGMAAQLEALHVLTQESKAMNAANVFIIFLFILLECTPVFVKLMAPRGPYDGLLEIREHFFKNHNLEKIAEMDHALEEKLKYFANGA